MLISPNPNPQARSSFLTLSETGAVEAIASAVPSDSVDALRIRFFSSSLTSTCQALASDMVIFLYMYASIYKVKKMAQVAVMGLGEASGYAIYEHHSDARAWSVTVLGKAEAVFDYFRPCISTDCKYESSENITIGFNRVKNVGDIAGTIYIKFQELDSAGNPLSGGVSCSKSIVLEAGEYAALKYLESTGACSIIKTTNADEGRMLLEPRSPGTYYFGIKTWAEGESEPPGEEGIGLAIPVTVASGLTLLGLGILQARSRRF